MRFKNKVTLITGGNFGIGFGIAKKFSEEELLKIGKEFESKMESKFLKKNTDEWIKFLRSHDIPCEPMQFTEELLDNKQAIKNKYVIELDHKTGGKVRSSGPIFNVSTGNAKLSSAPLLGENTKEVLSSMSLYLGMEIPNWPPDNIAELSKKLEENAF